MRVRRDVTAWLMDDDRVGILWTGAGWRVSGRAGYDMPQIIEQSIDGNVYSSVAEARDEVMAALLAAGHPCDGRLRAYFIRWRIDGVDGHLRRIGGWWRIAAPGGWEERRELESRRFPTRHMALQTLLDWHAAGQP